MVEKARVDEASGRLTGRIKGRGKEGAAERDDAAQPARTGGAARRSMRLSNNCCALLREQFALRSVAGALHAGAFRTATRWS